MQVKFGRWGCFECFSLSCTSCLKDGSEAGDVGTLATLLIIYLCIFQNAGNRMWHERCRGSNIYWHRQPKTKWWFSEEYWCRGMNLIDKTCVVNVMVLLDSWSSKSSLNLLLSSLEPISPLCWLQVVRLLKEAYDRVTKLLKKVCRPITMSYGHICNSSFNYTLV